MTLSHAVSDPPAIPSLTILVTGSTDGIGRATALALARMGHRVLVHGRDPAKGRAALAEVRKAGSPSPELFTADLSTHEGVRGLAGKVRDSHDRLDVLINNAGVYRAERTLTADGLEMTFAVNLLAPFLLSHLLMPLLSAAAPARIVNVASSAHFDADRMNWEDLQGERRYDAWGAYAQSKLGVVLMTAAFARRIGSGQVTVNCLHPGVICTKLLASAFPTYPCDSPESGARTPVYLATAPGVKGVTGKYFDGMEEARPSRMARDRDAQEHLWGVLGEMAGVSPFTA
ncbi:MAG TPA: SDR family NAD(P)-dependent oxidoreductase [Methanomicrobiales archaeon]|jgi:NAD(P)-dependent dehydrogenase (short-subunit alcohol dehydrogenase family)|nr:SDR family NAD(P)-dependent oxidoreductase [Methanomicrobiales archaeon]